MPDLPVDVVGNGVRKLLPLLPEPGILLNERRSRQRIARCVIKIAFDQNVFHDVPSSARSYERHIKIRQQIKPKSVRGANRRTFLRPAAPRPAVDIYFLRRRRREKLLTKLEVMEHRVRISGDDKVTR